jgi:hypothetical protein
VGYQAICSNFYVNLPRIQPINPFRIASAFDHEDWLFELKHDGFRAVAYIESEPLLP